VARWANLQAGALVMDIGILFSDLGSSHWNGCKRNFSNCCNESGLYCL